ncbi:BrnT family toxin, partial [Microcystis sp.]
NIEKHGIDFADLEAIFRGPIIERVDTRQNYGEIRVILVGTIDNIVLVVVYTWRGSVRRIISVRRANNRERRTYYQSHPRTVGEFERQNELGES